MDGDTQSDEIPEGEDAAGGIKEKIGNLKDKSKHKEETNGTAHGLIQKNTKRGGS